MFTQHDDMTRKCKLSFSVYRESITWMMYYLYNLPPDICRAPAGALQISSFRSSVTFFWPLCSLLTALANTMDYLLTASLNLSNCDMSSFVIGIKIWVETRLMCGPFNGTTNPALWKWFISAFWHSSMIPDWSASMWLTIEPCAVPILICRVPSYLCT